MKYLESIKARLQKLDNDLFNKYAEPMIRKNEETRIKANEKWTPFLVKAWKWLHPEYTIDRDNLTIPIKDPYYSLLYVRKFNTGELVVLTETLHKYAKSNTDHTVAIQELSKYRGFSPFKRKKLCDVTDTLSRSGATVDEALTLHFGELIDEKLVKSIKVGSESNRLCDSLDNYLEELRFDIRNGTRVKKALSYPLIVTIVILGLAVAGKLYLLPQLFEPLGITGDLIPSELNPLIFTADLVLKPWTMIEYIVYIFIITTLYKRSKTVSSFLDVVLLKLPVIGNYLITKDICFFFRNLYSYIESGMTSVLAHEKACEVIKIPTLRTIFESKSDKITKGESLATSYTDITFLKEDMRMILEVAEKNGDLSTALFTCTEMLKDEYQKITDNLVEQIPTMSTLFAGGLVVMIFLPVLGVVYNLDKFIMG